MRLNLKVRLRNPWFWTGLAGVILTAVGIRPEELASWEAVREAVCRVAGNPYLLGSLVMAVLGVVTDPTTQGLGDSRQAMTYEAPKREEM